MDDPYSLLIKPASADCNLACDYCFYLDKKTLYPDHKKHRMRTSTLNRIIERYLATPQPVYAMTWQGGEPALMGADFYEQAIDLQKRFAVKGSRMMNALQTNATCISDKLAALMARYRFLAGCSIDGPPDVHDRFRRGVTGTPTHAEVIKGVTRLSQKGVAVNILCMVTSANVDDPARVYTYFREMGVSFVQFIPCVAHDNNGDPLPWSITGRQWGKFLVKVFELWHAGDTKTMSIRNFESVLARLVMNQAAECRMADQCNQYLVVEYNGDVYPCDFFVEKRYLLGNIHDTSFETLRQSEVYQQFAAEKSILNNRCQQCEFLPLCMGDCRKFYTEKIGLEKISVLCSGWHHFYKTTLADFKKLAAAISKGEI